MHDKLSKIGNNFNFEDLRLNLTVNRLRIMSDYQQELPWSQKKKEMNYFSLAKNLLERDFRVLKSL